jgi:hypothetical protein
MQTGVGVGAVRSVPRVNVSESAAVQVATANPVPPNHVDGAVVALVKLMQSNVKELLDAVVSAVRRLVHALTRGPLGWLRGLRVPGTAAVAPRAGPKSSLITSPPAGADRMRVSEATLADLPQSWNGRAVTDKERAALLAMHTRRAALLAGGLPAGYSPWLQGAKSLELLRFLRHKHGHLEEAWRMVVGHARWRPTRHGADTIARGNAFEGSPLHREVFWLGLSKQGCPTMVIRTKAHDGADYNEDPTIFTAFVVSVLEQGRKLYDVGVSRPVCLIMDRGPYERDGVPKVPWAPFPILCQTHETPHDPFRTPLTPKPTGGQDGHVRHPQPCEALPAPVQHHHGPLPGAPAHRQDRAGLLLLPDVLQDHQPRDGRALA